MLVTADTNIWISALNYHGNPKRLIEMARAAEIDLAISDPIITETRRILTKQFDWPHEDIEEAVTEMREMCRHVVPGSSSMS